MNINKICILGLGYIGLPTASTFAANGVMVVGMDVNTHIIDTLHEGKIHIHEPGLQAAVLEAIRSGKLRVSTQVEDADAFVIAVPTPFHQDKVGDHQGLTYKLADMRAVIQATEAVVPHLRKGNLVVLESTSPPRTTVDLVAPILEKSGLKAGVDFHLCYSPERVLPGQILRELIENTRVIGGITPESAKAGRDLYAFFVKGDILQTDATTAEMVKLMENTYRDVNIAIANEFSRLADKLGVDVWEAISLANRHPRVKILNPGPGVGGHCISVDPWFFVEAAPEITPLIYNARRVNDTQPHFVLGCIKRALGTLQSKKIALLGMAYKPEVDDLRESPAGEVADLLYAQGAQLKAWEPFKLDATRAGVEFCKDLRTALGGVDAVVLLVGHAQLLGLKPVDVSKLTEARVVIDTVNGWNKEKWEQAGFKVIRLGVSSSYSR